MIDNNDNVNIKVFKHREKKIIKDSMKNIIKMMIPTQIAIDLQIEILKVQAIIARTMLVRKIIRLGGNGCSEHPGSDICDTGHCFDMVDDDYLRKKWKDKYNENMNKLERVVNDTKGLIITINNKPINPMYHDTCGGSTVNSEDVMGNRVVYLRKVLCDNCQDSPNWQGYKDYTLKEIEQKMNISFPKITPTSNTEIKGTVDEIVRDREGRVKTIKIGETEFKGKEVMDTLNLDSTRFSVSPVIVRFNTRGKGHGLGLCQYGANQMAIDGHNYEEIIDYYFTGIKIKEIEFPCIENPLSGKTILIDPGHGGEESDDVIGQMGLKEKDVVLNIGKKLRDSLQKLGAIIHMTRDEDEYVSLGERAKVGNNIKPDFFISIHLNSFSNSSVRGCEIYHYKNDSDGQSFGKSIMNSIVENTGVVNRGVKSADFFLLRNINASSIQLELDYITNLEAERKLKDNSYIEKIVKSIVMGIVNYYKY